MMIIFLSFVTLTLLGLLREDLRKSSLSRSKEEWTVDMAGLFIQGVIIPAFPFLVLPVLSYILPNLDRRLEMDSVLQFILGFFLVDYLYYWNHRYFHTKNFWHLHRLHHSARYLDVFATSRNSLLTSFLFVYVWVQILALFLLKDSSAFMLGLVLTFALDLWRHSGLETPSTIRPVLGWLLILPEQHVFHHSLQGRNKNFGANICWWDKLHGTFSENLIQNKNLERMNEKNVWRELILPAKAGK